MADVSGLSLTTEERRFLQQPALGAVILFSRNFESPAQLRNLINEIKQLRSPSLLIAVDQEGGRVQRFREHFVALPPLLSLGTDIRADPENAVQRAYSAARLMALELRKFGIDFSFAPVLDIANPKSQIIGDRGFHEHPDCITQLASAYIDGMMSAGMQATGKHFPGHGGVVEDSHLETPSDQRSFEEILRSDLKPYRQLGNQLAAVMTAHIAFPNIDQDLPTFSSFWIQKVLRQSLGFNGLVFSDDLTMKGAEVAGSPTQRANKALAAGCDMVLICNDPDSARSVASDLGENQAVNQPRLQRMRGKDIPTEVDEITKLRNAIVV